MSDTLRRFVHRHFVNSVDIHSLEVGGNGDCLFHSVAAGLERLLLQSTAASRHALRRVPLRVFSSGARAVVQQLRNIFAEQIEQWSWEELLNYFVTAAMNQQLRTWNDQWNPTALFGDLHLECIIGCDIFRAISDNHYGDIGN